MIERIFTAEHIIWYVSVIVVWAVLAVFGREIYRVIVESNDTDDDDKKNGGQ